MEQMEVNAIQGEVVQFIHRDLVLQGSLWSVEFSRTDGVVVNGEVNDCELMEAVMSVGLPMLALRVIQAVITEMKK